MQIGSKSYLEGKPVCPAAPYKEFLVTGVPEIIVHCRENARFFGESGGRSCFVNLAERY